MNISPVAIDDGGGGGDDDDDEREDVECKLCGRLKRNADEWRAANTSTSMRQANSRMKSVWSVSGISEEMDIATLLSFMSADCDGEGEVFWYSGGNNVVDWWDGIITLLFI